MIDALKNLSGEPNECIKVAFVIDDRTAGSYDARQPNKGNPGIGGTQYCFLALAAELASSVSLIKPILYHNNPDALMPSWLDCKVISGGQSEMSLAVIDDKNDIAVVRGSGAILQDPLTRQKNVQLLVWIHNHLPRKILEFIGNSIIVKHVVFCGEEQRMLAYDTAAFVKSSAIFNTHYIYPHSRNIIREKDSAVYIGSVIPSKGLHRLLRLWPSVREKCPAAKLHIIGSGALYDKKSELGRLGIAEYKYENKLLQYINNDPDGFGVKFHGLLGYEKFTIMAKCAVGVPNPTALTECCPGSVLECSALGLPIIGRAKFGMVDTIIDNETGFLVGNDKEFIDKMVYLFSNETEVLRLGSNGVKFVDKQFSSIKILTTWEKLLLNINELSLSSEALNLKGKYSYKFLIKINATGKNSFISIIRDTFSKFETVWLKVR
jgi:glycosyltransferase involved in cell wall biosynthesis